MENESDILQSINQSIVFLSDEYKERKMDLENTKFLIKKQKQEYNSEIKEYNNLLKTILIEEGKIEDIEKCLNKFKYKQKMIIMSVNNDFVKHFNDFSSRVPSDVIESLVEYFGYSKTSYSILSKIIQEESELKSVMEYSELMNSYLDTIYNKTVKNNNKSMQLVDFSQTSEIKLESTGNLIDSYTSIRNKIFTVKNKYQNYLQYPFDQIYDYIISVYNILDKKEERDFIMNKIDFIKNQKNTIFLGLKTLESEIMKNDNLYRIISKYIKSINLIFDKFKSIKEIPPNTENRNEKLKDFDYHLNNFKKLNVNNMRRYDNMTSLTLKSEYSEEFSEIVTQLKTEEVENVILAGLASNKTDDKSFHNHSIKETITAFSASKIESEKSKVKNAKHIKNKKLQNSISEFELNEGLKPIKKNSKLKSWNKELKPMKTKPKFSININKYSTNSPRNAVKSGVITNTNNTQSSNFTNSYHNDPKGKRNQTQTPNNGATVQKTKSQSALINSDLKNLPPRKLSEDFGKGAKKAEISNTQTQFNHFRKDSTDRGRVHSPNNYVDRIDAALSLIKNNTFSPSTSSQSHILFPPQVDNNLENVCDEWIISPLNNLPIRSSKLISDKHVRAKGNVKSMPNYANLKIDKPINNQTGCCVSCT